MKFLRTIHYAWVVVLAGTLTIVAVLGLGRFSLGMFLPSMANDLGLGYSRMGYIGTGNFIDYKLLQDLLQSHCFSALDKYPDRLLPELWPKEVAAFPRHT